mmetsp:Transcript_136516/g.323325  ORF Transcript_136516/g.323325 Transcript_136516/m.323325 type:complete len:200 (+) Transcript_136516:1084-1683(+)
MDSWHRRAKMVRPPSWPWRDPRKAPPGSRYSRRAARIPRPRRRVSRYRRWHAGPLPRAMGSSGRRNPSSWQESALAPASASASVRPAARLPPRAPCRPCLRPRPWSAWSGPGFGPRKPLPCARPPRRPWPRASLQAAAHSSRRPGCPARCDPNPVSPCHPGGSPGTWWSQSAALRGPAGAWSRAQARKRPEPNTCTAPG